jgi:hypothetical protein
MHHDHQPPDLGQPALIVTYGQTLTRRRALDKDVMLLGRSPICDLVLSSQEVAPVHCVLARSAGGWRVRDCGGRIGARLNGALISDCLLRDGDMLQVGTFNFELHLPSDDSSPPGPPPLPPAAEAPSGDTVWFERRQAELDRRQEQVLLLERDLEARLRQLRLEQAELALAQAEVEERARAAPPAPPAPPPPAPPAPPAVPPSEAVADLDRRAAELGHFARHLLHQRQQIHEQREELERRGRTGSDKAAGLRRENEKLQQTLADQEKEGEALVGRLEDLEGQLESLREEAARRDARIEELEQALRVAEEQLKHQPTEGKDDLGGSWPDTDIRDKLAWVRRLKEELAQRRQTAAQ